ncbi:probable E3 SUMO-protein ligase RNF212 [Solea solea]|uniref:probable E3 SUMO-protein ligase RNF212 n=1 Tax=Solea solea TaxID=90069 RepID=UPI00272C082B|nr:probable E3 SUMO-protein ligase RNF212 [Solea solea]
MAYWICCNSCFLYPSTNRRLAVTTCGHIICSVCHQQGTQGKCLICNTKCQVSPLSDTSSSEVKALFSDINVVATKHLAEIRKVMMFQTRHNSRLLSFYQQRNEKLEEALVKMRHEIQQMSKKLNEQSAYISKLENCLQHQSVKASSGSQRSYSTPHGHKPVLQIPYNSPVCLSRHSSSTNVNENMAADERFRKPQSVPRLSLISLPRDEHMGTRPHRSSSQNILTNHMVRSSTVSHSHGAPATPEFSFGLSSGWTSPIFKAPTSFRHSMSSLLCPRP